MIYNIRMKIEHMLENEQADALLGPYEMVENLVNPGEHKAGDFDMIKDEETGKAYLYFDADHSAVSDSWDSEFVSLGDPHVDDETTASFNSQISKIFRVEGRDNLFVAMADRWLPHYHVDARIADIFTRTVACNYAPDKYQANDEERTEMYRGNILETANTSVADYVWLPIQLDAPCEEYPNGRVRIEWKDSWTV